MYKIILLILFIVPIQSCEHNNLNKSHNTKLKIYKKELLDYVLYNENGEISEIRNLNQERTKIENSLKKNTAIAKYKYHNNKLHEIEFLNADSTASRIHKHKFFYNEKDLINRRIWIDKSGLTMEIGEVKYKYNDNNQLTHKIRPSDKDFPSLTTYKYDEKGRLIQQAFFDGKNDQISLENIGIHHISYKYNDKNQLIKEIIHYSGYVTAGIKRTEPIYKGVSEFFYIEGKLSKRTTRPKENDKSDMATYYYKYSKDEKLYGKHKESKNEDIVTNIPYETLGDPISRALYMNGNQIIKHIVFD